MGTSMSLENLEHMTPDEEKRFFRLFARQLATDDGAEARSHLEAGLPIYYCDDDTPDGLVKRLYPDGRLELVDFVLDELRVVRVLQPQL